MSLQLLPRIPFGPSGDPAQCAPWPVPVSAFNLQWLSGTFAPAQRDRLAKITGEIQGANKKIEALRAALTSPTVGERKTNGVVLRSGNDVQLERTLRTHAQNQLVRDIIAVRQPLDLTVVPILKEMARASLTVDTLRERVFDKISCLARAGVTGLKAPEVMAYKASVMNAYRDVSPVELNRLIQAAIDDGSGDSLVVLDVLRMLNFSRSKDDRGGENARLLALANVPEFTEAAPLLDEVQDLNKQASLLWAQFQNHSNRVSIMKMSAGLQKFQTANPQDPYADLG